MAELYYLVEARERKKSRRWKVACLVLLTFIVLENLIIILL